MRAGDEVIARYEKIVAEVKWSLREGCDAENCGAYEASKQQRGARKSHRAPFFHQQCDTLQYGAVHNRISFYVPLS